MRTSMTSAQASIRETADGSRTDQSGAAADPWGNSWVAGSTQHRTRELLVQQDTSRRKATRLDHEQGQPG